MKRKIFAVMCGVLFTLAGHAQSIEPTPFYQGKTYVSAYTSGLNLNWNQRDKWNLELGAKAGYFFDDNWMISANAEYDVIHAAPNFFKAGAGLRYYFDQCGIYIGAGSNYAHCDSYNDFMPTAQVGYAFFLNRTVTIEPEVYYNQSLKNHHDYSGLGFRIGIGIYFE